MPLPLIVTRSRSSIRPCSGFSTCDFSGIAPSSGLRLSMGGPPCDHAHSVHAESPVFQRYYDEAYLVLLSTVGSRGSRQPGPSKSFLHHGSHRLITGTRICAPSPYLKKAFTGHPGSGPANTPCSYAIATPPSRCPAGASPQFRTSSRSSTACLKRVHQASRSAHRTQEPAATFTILKAWPTIRLNRSTTPRSGKTTLARNRPGNACTGVLPLYAWESAS